MADIDKISPEDAAMRQRVHRVELVLSYTLRAGVITSTLIVLAGLVVTFLHNPGYMSSTRPVTEVFNEVAFPRTIAEVVTGLAQGQGRAIIVLGLFFLIATPVTRVGLSVLIFLHQRDRTFAIITAIVFVLLIVSFFVGHAGG